MRFAPIAPSEPPRREESRKPGPSLALKRLIRRIGFSRADTDLDSLARRIQLPWLPISDEEHARTQLHDTGQRLARQEDWTRLAERIAEADACREHTPGGASAAVLLAEGARADVVAAATDAVGDGRAPDPAGLDALEQVHADQPKNYAIALVVALAHVDVGRAWRMHQAKGPDAQECEARFLDHFRRAEDLLGPFDAKAHDAPSLAAAQSALLAARPAPRRRVSDDYAQLIALDPDSALSLRALGTALLPARFGDFPTLDQEARRLAARTGIGHGSGAYTWVWLDALALDPDGLGTVDTRLFIEGLHAIAAQDPDQHIINELAAFCGITMAPRKDATRLPTAQDRARGAIHACLDWLVARHLYELHPLIWAQAQIGPNASSPLPPRRALMTQGRRAALRVIAARFADDLIDGSTLGFSNMGMYRLPAL